LINIEREITPVKLYIFDNAQKLCSEASRKFNLYELCLEEHCTKSFVYKSAQDTLLTFSNKYP